MDMTPCQLELVGTALESIWNFVKDKIKITFRVILNVMRGFLIGFKYEN